MNAPGQAGTALEPGAAPVSILDVNAHHDAGPLGQDALSDDDRQLLERRRRVLGPAAPLMYDRPLHIVRGEGAWLIDAAGRRYLDMYNNVAGVGHCHPRVVAAISRQAATLNTNTRYLHGYVVDYAERLLATFPDRGPHRVMFTCTGSEANDLAVRIARWATGADGVIVTEAAYHGGTTVSAACSPSTGAVDDVVVTVPAPDGRSLLDDPADRASGDAGLADRWAGEVSAAMDELARRGRRTAALLVDTVFSSDGIHPGTPGMLDAAAALVHERGGLVIADEVQPGFGRLGTGMWGHTRHDIAPDLVTLGKPMANGMPVAGLVGRADLIDGFCAGENYFNTFAGNPVSMAAATAVLDVIEDEGLIAHAAEVGRRLLDGVRTVTADDPTVGEVRGLGLFVAVEYVDADGRPDRRRAARVINALRDRGVLISACGRYGNALKIRPPMVLSPGEADLFIGRLEQAGIRRPGPAATDE